MAEIKEITNCQMKQKVFFNMFSIDCYSKDQLFCFSISPIMMSLVAVKWTDLCLSYSQEVSISLL